MSKVSIIVTVKNRVEHFIQTFPSLITQYGVPYELIFVDFYSEDGFTECLVNEIEKRKIIFSPYLKKITTYRVNTPIKFNSGKAKNLGAYYASGEYLAFSDIDVFLGMNYLTHTIGKIEKSIFGLSFYSTRKQHYLLNKLGGVRILPEINYGNMVVGKEWYDFIKGHNENNLTWGGDDDELMHRMKLFGLHEINPENACDANHYSILHGDELRRKELEDTTVEHTRNKMAWAHSATEPYNKAYGFVDKIQEHVVQNVLYEKK